MIAGAGEVCYDKAIHSRVCFNSRRCKSRRAASWEDGFGSTIYSARTSGYQANISEWNFLAGEGIGKLIFSFCVLFVCEYLHMLLKCISCIGTINWVYLHYLVID